MATFDISMDVIAGLKKTYEQFNPGYPFKYTFLDDGYEQMYRSERATKKLTNYFAVIAIFISCLGLFAIASLTAEQRTKEIGIRKVLGASVSGLVILFSTDFMKLILVAFFVAAPVAYYLGSAWLANFAYHIKIEPGLFVIAGLAAFIIGCLTVNFQSIRLALANPVDSLRSE